jgi:hypothetical protein
VTTYRFANPVNSAITEYLDDGTRHTIPWPDELAGDMQAYIENEDYVRVRDLLIAGEITIEPFEL